MTSRLTSPDVIVALLVTVTVALILAYLVYEDWALITGNHAITFYFRGWRVRHPSLSGALILAIGALFGHLWWK